MEKTKIENIIYDYSKNNMFINDLSKKYNLSNYFIKKILNENNIDIRTKSENKKLMDDLNLCRVLQVDFNYFKSWTHNMAYILGFIAADGNIWKNRLRINLKNTDSYILEKIKKELKFTGKIRHQDIKLKNKVHKTSYLSINSKTLVKDLNRLGINERKSDTIDFPMQLPEKFELDFIREYFDGDGSVGINYPTNKSKIRTKSPQIRTRFCSGSVVFIEKLIRILHKYGMRMVKIENYNARKTLFEIAYSTKDSIIFYNLIYKKEIDLYLERKKEIFEQGIDLRNKIQTINSQESEASNLIE